MQVQINEDTKLSHILEYHEILLSLCSCNEMNVRATLEHLLVSTVEIVSCAMSSHLVVFESHFDVFFPLFHAFCCFNRMIVY